MMRLRHLLLLLRSCLWLEIIKAWSEPKISDRRSWLQRSSQAMLVGTLYPPPIVARAADDTTTVVSLQTAAVGQEEYTNSITASRDTNISPKEAYDTILAQIPRAPKNSGAAAPPRALDLGAGAGLSTQLLYDLGYTTIDAVDWSDEAWNTHVTQCPPSVQFYAMADDAFFQYHQQHGLPKYDVIVYNFAVNPAKALRVAKDLLLSDQQQDEARLLAPVNDKTDYWYKQSYWVLDAKGDMLYQSRPEVGAWSVQFQPDVTSSTCTGIWCGDVNGFAAQQQQQTKQYRIQ